MRWILLLVAAFSGLTCAQEEQATVGLLKAFAPSKDVAANVAVRSEALKAVQGFDSQRVASALLAVAGRLAGEVNALEEARRDYLGTTRNDREAKARGALDPVHTLQDELHATLLALRAPESLQIVVGEALTEAELPMTLRVSLVRRVSDLGESALKGVKRSLARARDPGALVVALVATGALGRQAGKTSRKVIALLAHPEVVVREQAAFALSTLCDPASVEPLIELLARERGRTRDRIGAALEVLTRQPLGSSGRSWRRWWDTNGEQVLAGEVPLGGGKVSVETAAESDSAYHSIPMTGESILYVIDTSKSMQRGLETGGKQTEEGEASRFERASEELIAALGKLPPHKRFNIVTFAGKVTSYACEMMPAAPANVSKAQAWVRAIELELGTALYDGLDLTFALAGRPPRDVFYSSSADTIFMLTDGRPMRPKIGKSALVGDDKDAILAAVRRWNLLDRVVVHTIGLGKGIPAKFLTKMAAQNGGQFVHEK